MNMWTFAAISLAVRFGGIGMVALCVYVRRRSDTARKGGRP